MFNLRFRGSFRLGLLTTLAFAAFLSSCSSDKGGDGGLVQPGEANLAMHFSVYQLTGTSGKSAPTGLLLWKGTSDGPDADSPQQTANARIPGAEPFRIDWELVDPSTTIRGYQFRATQAPAEGDRRMPRDASDTPYWGDQQSFVCENSTPIEDITSRCPTGGDCPEVLLFGSDEVHSFWAFASTEDGQETPLDQARLQFEIVNAVPTTELVVDGTYPYYHMADGLGGELRATIADGDTIPAGAKVVFKLSGEDPDPVVLKTESLPRVRYQGRYEMDSRSGPTRQLQTNYSSPAANDTIAFTVGPFEYRFYGRAVDRLRAVDPTPVEFSFVAGYAPSLTAIQPTSSDQLLLRRPSDGTWPENTVDYQVTSGVTRYWTGTRFLDTEVSGSEQWQGDLLRIPLKLEGIGDPREPATGGFGAARSFSYEWHCDNDPGNFILDGGRNDNLSSFNDATSAGELLLSGQTGIEVFVPAVFWSNPSVFEPGNCEGASSLDYCGVGDYLRRQLGEVTLIAQTRNTQHFQSFEYFFRVIDEPSQSIVTDIGESGLLSAADSTSFPLHLGLDDGGGGALIWP